jgi:hypothetical protein
LNANTGTGLTYQWKNNGTNISGATGASYTATSAGSYTVVVSNTNGCSATSTATTVTVNPNITPNFNQVAAICSGGTLSALPTTSTNGITGTWSPALNNTAITTYTFTPTAGQCAVNTTMTITVNANPPATITAGGVTTFCQGGSVVLNANTGTVLTYQWKNNGTNISGATGASYTATAAGSYTVVVTNTNGCSATSTATTVTVNALPTVSAGIDQTVCSGSSVVLAGTGADVFTWNNGLSNAVAFTPTLSAIYTVTGTNLATGCSNTDQVLVNVNSLPNVNAGNDQAICSGASVILSGSGADVYTWNNGVSNSVSFSPNLSAIYTVTGTNLATGCSNSDQVLVTVNSLPNVNAGNDQAICSGASVILSGSGADVYSWNNGVSNSVSFTPTLSAIYAVTGTNLVTGCSNSDQVIVTVNSLPNVNAGSDQSICAGTSVVLSGSGADVYTWNNGVSNSVSFTPTLSAIYTVTGSNLITGCSNTDQVLVTVNALPNVNAGIDQVVCSASSVVLSGSGADVYNWNNGVSNGVGFTPSISTLYTVTGTNQLTGCSNTDQVFVTVNNNPLVTLASFSSVCDSLGIIILSGGSPSGGTYSGTSVSNNSFNTTIGTGTYPITYSYSDLNGCSSTASQNLTVINCEGSDIIELKENNIILYPNPTMSELVIEVFQDYQNQTYIVRDVSGRLIFTGELTGNKTNLQVSALSTGTYYFTLPELNQTLRFIKN